MKAKELIAGLLCFMFVVSGAACKKIGKEDKIKSDMPDFSKFDYIADSGANIIIDNGIIRVSIGKEHGEINGLTNKAVGEELISSSSGLPFSIEYGYNRNEVSISSDSPSIVTFVKAYKDGDKEILHIEYADLKSDRSKKSTGISAAVQYEIGGGDYFTYSCSFDLGGMPAGDEGEPNGIYSLKFMDGFLNGAGNSQRLTAPTWNGGQFWKDPWANTKFRSVTGATLGYPGNDAESLQAGWLDLSGDKGGIGIGIIDRQELLTEFRIYGDPLSKSVRMENVLFDPVKVLGESVPLLKGENFTSDKILVVAHGGDWHDTVNAYRYEYEKAFAGDYISKENMSGRARELDYISRAFGLLYGGSVTSFAQMYNNTVKFMNETDAEYEHHAFWLTGHNRTGYAYDIPMMTPVLESAGGEAGLKKFISDLHAKGGSIYTYEHPFAVDPDREEVAAILEKVDPRQHTEYWDGVTHHSICIDNSFAYDFWKNTVLPPQIALGINGIQFDQAPLWQTVCDMEGHNHSDKAISRLSSHAKAVVNLQKTVKESIDDGYIVSESYNDVISRYCDVAQLCWHQSLLWDGLWEYGAAVYSNPGIVYHASGSGLFWDPDYDRYIQQNLWLQGALYGCIDCLDGEGGDLSLKQEFVRFKKAIRHENNCGYPFGFKDNVGITVSDVWLDARVFTEGNKVTVVYLSNYHVKDAVITVDLEKLGFNGKGTVSVNVTQPMNKLGYKIIDV